MSQANVRPPCTSYILTAKVIRAIEQICTVVVIHLGESHSAAAVVAGAISFVGVEFNIAAAHFALNDHVFLPLQASSEDRPSPSGGPVKLFL